MAQKSKKITFVRKFRIALWKNASAFLSMMNLKVFTKSGTRFIAITTFFTAIWLVVCMNRPLMFTKRAVPYKACATSLFWTFIWPLPSMNVHMILQIFFPRKGCTTSRFRTNKSPPFMNNPLVLIKISFACKGCFTPLFRANKALSFMDRMDVFQ